MLPGECALVLVICGAGDIQKRGAWGGAGLCCAGVESA